MRTLALSALVLASACTREPVDPNPLPEFVDDCDGALNDDVDTVSGILADGTDYEGVELCPDDVDIYRIDIPANSWASVKLIPAHGGSGDSDLDLWQIDDPSNPVDERMDFVDDEEGENVLWYSATEQDFERLAWYNPSDERLMKYIMVNGYDGAYDDYDLDIETSDWHEGMECDEFYPDADPTDEEGPCNRIMQFPQANTVDDGYLVTHEAHYSNERREVAYLVRWAAAETAAAFEDTNPLALMDMSQFDGDVPGRMRGQLRHPEGTHVNGNDMDIAYYQNGDDNYGRVVCSQADEYFCQGPADMLDARRTAYFMMMLMRSPNMRVIGVDPEIAGPVREAANDLRDEGLVNGTDVSNLSYFMASGEGWPFHHHHMHLSWEWEDGWSEGRSQVDLDSCAGDEWVAPLPFSELGRTLRY